MIGISTAAGLAARLLASASLLASPEGEAPAARLADPATLSAVYGPASEARIEAAGPGEIAAGWCVEQGPNAGVYILGRSAGTWRDLPAVLPAGSGEAPRDLDMARDAAGHVHAVWTALEGGHRRVFHAAADADGSVLIPPRALNPDDDADADFPQIEFDARLGYFVVWQSARVASFTLEAALIDLTGRAANRLTPVSGPGQVALAPQVLSGAPTIVAWYELQGGGTALRLSRFNFLGAARWEPLPLPRADLPTRLQPGLTLDPAGTLVACWIEPAADGPSAAIVQRGVEAGSPRASFGEAGSEALQPQARAAGEGFSTLVWQSAARGEQSIQLAVVDWREAGSPKVVLRRALSPSTDRFASDPSHASAPGWTAAVWVDNWRDGGAGRVGFAEVLWPAE